MSYATFGAIGGAAVTPADNAKLAKHTRGIYVGVAGDLTVVMRSGDTLTFSGLVAGVIHPIQAIEIKAAGTTATGIVAVW